MSGPLVVKRMPGRRGESEQNSSRGPAMHLPAVFNAISTSRTLPVAALYLVGQLPPLAGKFHVHADHTGVPCCARLRLAFQRLRSHLFRRHCNTCRSCSRRTTTRPPRSVSCEHNCTVLRVTDGGRNPLPSIEQICSDDRLQKAQALVVELLGELAHCQTVPPRRQISISDGPYRAHCLCSAKYWNVGEGVAHVACDRSPPQNRGEQQRYTLNSARRKEKPKTLVQM